MGAWGTAIFSDDTARDVRDDYHRLIGDGLSNTDAAKTLIHKWQESLRDADDAPVFWLALAATQWKCGRLDPEISKQALHVIDSGSDLKRWDAGSRDYRKRADVLQRLRAQLTSPQPSQRRIAKQFKNTTNWKVGDLVSYRLISGKLAIFRVIGHDTDQGGTAAVCELMNWTGIEIPEEATLQKLGILRRKHDYPNQNPQLMLGAASAKERPVKRLKELGITLKPKQSPKFFSVVLWRFLDDFLEREFGLR